MSSLATLCPESEHFAGKRHDYLIHSESLPRAAEARVDGWIEALTEAYFEATGNAVELVKLDRPRKRLLATLCENIRAHHRAAMQAGMPHALLRVSEGARAQVGLKETVTTADIATFTTQELAYVVDLFAPFIIPEIFTTVTMTGPTAFIHRQRYLREDADGFYSAGSALAEGLDPSYSECPAECEASNGIDVEVTAELIEADCRRLSAQYCIPANYHYSSQYGGDLGAVLMEGMTIEFRRAIQAHLLSLLVASAGGTRTWNRTPTAGSYYASANPREWTQELYNTIRLSNNDVLKDADGRISLNIVLGDVDAIYQLEKAVPMEFIDNQPTDFARGRVDEMSAFLGRTKVDRFDVFRILEGFPADRIVVMSKNDRNPTAVYAPWIPITSLGVLTDPETGRVKMGAITLYGVSIVRPRRVRLIALGP